MDVKPPPPRLKLFVCLLLLFCLSNATAFAQFASLQTLSCFHVHTSTLYASKGNGASNRTKRPPLSMSKGQAYGGRLGETPEDYLELLNYLKDCKKTNTKVDKDSDVRQTCHPMMASTKISGDMELGFIGTASCSPSSHRGVSCVSLRMNVKERYTARTDETDSIMGGHTWLFDCGEGTQGQIQKAKFLKAGKINKIFLTHSHGDHSFGLPSLLCLIGPERNKARAPPIDIYGPEGLRMWLRCALHYSVSRSTARYRVHELKEVPHAPEWKRNQRNGRFVNVGPQHVHVRGWAYGDLDPEGWVCQSQHMKLNQSYRYGESQGGRDIYPVYDHDQSADGAPVWELEDNAHYRVAAAPMSHSVACLGYVVEEKEKPGRLRNEVVAPIVTRNFEGLKDAGHKVPMKVMAVVKNMKVGESFTFPDGTILKQEEATGPPVRGRKIVICGDTASARSLLKLGSGADVLVHEATNTHLPGIDRDTTVKSVARDAVDHGHSTPQMAGDFARALGAKRLVLTHFSSRYRGDQTLESMAIMAKIEEQAAESSGLGSSNVVAAWDFMVLTVGSPVDGDAATPTGFGKDSS
eukprot:Nitzschia sp. Nitz4//scaffold6_size259037//59135//61153//NITZ4_001054-RA/size259037-augustus-gene-0.285-mRNA-1//1//CDS//3329556833//2331//frame0